MKIRYETRLMRNPARNRCHFVLRGRSWKDIVTHNESGPMFVTERNGTLVKWWELGGKLILRSVHEGSIRV